ncbi:hypothetical protein OOZ15_09445 [Galbibacter sp. EGI 63066]|uniref:hypothetical protein n=1 Tax=Galbibacter sp. EGI 63066 TaxID=2993559 RepID=UPI002249319F|nr:hypothetical protein [Galbibacter sp. EGI 63066]MCX2680162.1 hypothetical protein [Galbibacter sp. EGI 63066]
MIKKLLKYLVIILVVFGLICAVVYFTIHEPLPVGKQGPEAEMLAQKMLKAVNYTNYTKTRFIEWSFNGKHFYKWDKQEEFADVKWDNNLVKLNLNNYSISKVYRDGVELFMDPKDELIDTAVKYFNNDSFWLVAPFKIMDKGVERSLVTLKNGDEALLVTFTEGGTTPGDSYLWILDDNGFPQSFKMWVKIIPVGGLEASWDNWKVMETTTYLPTSHKFLFLNFDMGEVKAYNQLP